MTLRKFNSIPIAAIMFCLAVAAASAQSFRVQCPDSTSLHPNSANDQGVSPAYTGPQSFPFSVTPDSGVSFNVPGNFNNGGTIKCQQLSGGDGYATMADGTQTYLFAFGPLSGLSDLANGKPGTQPHNIFNTPFNPAASAGTAASNGAVGLSPEAEIGQPLAGSGAFTGHVDPRQIMDVGVMNGNIPAPTMAIDEDDEFFLTLTNVGQIMRPDLFEQHTVHFHGYPNASTFFDGVPEPSVAINIGGSFTYYYLAPDAGTYFWHCHITPPEHLQMGMVGQLYVRPRQNRVPSNSSLYTALRNQQTDLRTACYPHVSTSSTVPDLQHPDILCTTPLPASGETGATGGYAGGAATKKYAYNDGDGSTRYDVEYAIQLHGFDPNFHFVGMTFNPETFGDMKDKYFLLNGRSYPDTVNATGYRDASQIGDDINPLHGAPAVSSAMYTQSPDGVPRPSQPLSSRIVIPAGGRALVRLSSLDVTEHQTLASQGVPMTVIALNARLLRDLAGNNLYYRTNSITLGGGESLDVMLDSCSARGPAPGYQCITPIPNGTYYLYTPQLDHLSNDAENFGGLMTEVVIQ
jgi:FtsP/CotA-like multicopper oxidase with cupredoxin domain